jgi:Virulence-associated protein E
MTTHPAPEGGFYGASAAEWAWWWQAAGADVITAVADPRIPRYVRTNGTVTANDLAKTPSIVDFKGQARGINDWPNNRATEAQAVEWARLGGYNILVITRNIRAIDIDVSDPALADRVEAYFTSALGPMPVRWRSNSPKRTMLLRLNPHQEFSKRIVHHGDTHKTELLATGNQSAVAGTHTSGARFQLRGHENGIPTFEHARFTQVFDNFAQVVMSGAPTLYAKYKPLSGAENEARGLALLRQAAQVNGGDPVVAFLQEQGMVKGYRSNGMIDVRCPWEAEHTERKHDAEDTSTTYFPAGLGGLHAPGFKCLHGHCDGRGTQAFLRQCGYEEAQINETFSEGLPKAEEYQAEEPAITPALALAVPQEANPQGAAAKLKQALFAATTGAPGAVSKASVEAQMFLARDPKGKPQKTLENLQWALCAPKGQTIFLDDFEHTVKLAYPDGTVKPVDDNTVTAFRMAIESALGVTFSVEDTRSTLHYVAAMHRFDSAAERTKLLRGKWDGVPRLDTFDSETLGVLPTPYSKAACRYLWVSMVARAIAPGVKVDGALILISPAQGKGKTSLVQSLPLVPEWYGRIDLSGRDDDTFRVMRGKNVLEIPELRGIGARDAGAVKAFLDQQIDEWTPKYKEFASKAPRRSIFVGTDNNMAVLTDPTGNRRWFPLRVGDTLEFIKWPELRDNIEQYWAEALHVLDQYPDPQAAVEHHYKAADKLAAPARRASQVRDAWTGAVAKFMADQPPGTSITLDALLAKIGVQLDRRNASNAARVRGIMTFGGYLEVAPDEWQPLPPQIII